MDRDLLRQCLSYHGQSLFSILNCEQNENPDFKQIAADLSKAPYQRKEKKASSAVEQFIARKADLLFAPSWKSSAPSEEEWLEETDEPYAVMPPLEQFMDILSDERRDLFYRDVERGDAVIGRINSIRDFGFFLTLICLSGGLERDIEDLKLTALCPVRDVPSTGNHDDPLSYFQVGDLIRAGVKDIDRYHGKVTVSLQPSSLSSHLSKLKLGVISREDMPLHYSRGLKVASSTSETYERVLESSLGFSNPTNVEFLLGKLGISEVFPPSLMRGLQSKNFSEEDYGTSIRKKQSASWALKCVKSGVDHFKSGRHVEAMNEYNKALEIDADNIEALVARGALYATKGSLVKAMDDFELALKNCPTHRNARKYLCQTLVERGCQLEEEEKLVTAESMYKKALALDDAFKEAEEALKKLQVHIQKSLKLREEGAAREQEKSKNVETSAEKLRKILKEEKRLKRKKRRSSSSSSSSSTSSTSSDSSSGRKKSKKRKHKRGHSSHSSKKRRRKVSPREKSSGGKDEWSPAPLNTSASFMNQQQHMDTLTLDQESPTGRSRCYAKRRKSQRSISSSSAEVWDDSRGRFDDDPFENEAAPQQAKSSQGKEGWSRSRESKSTERRTSGGGKELSRVYGDMEENYFRLKEVYNSPETSRNRRLSYPLAGSEHSYRSDCLEDYHDAQGCSSRQLESAKCVSHSSTDMKLEAKDRRRCDSYHSLSGGRSQNGRSATEENSKKDLPQNLLDIFTQIAQFEKEKGNKIKK